MDFAPRLTSSNCTATIKKWELAANRWSRPTKKGTALSAVSFVVRFPGRWKTAVKSNALLSIAVSLVALASCGTSGRSEDKGNGEAAVEDRALTKLTLASDAFTD